MEMDDLVMYQYAKKYVFSFACKNDRLFHNCGFIISARGLTSTPLLVEIN
jgi:hypothetical protein